MRTEKNPIKIDKKKLERERERGFDGNLFMKYVVLEALFVNLLVFFFCRRLLSCLSLALSRSFAYFVYFVRHFE